jgi:hypothetical protein
MNKERKKFLVETAADKRMMLLAKKYSGEQLNNNEIEELRFLDLIMDVLNPSVTENEIERLVQLNLTAGLYKYLHQDA